MYIKKINQISGLIYIKSLEKNVKRFKLKYIKSKYFYKIFANKLYTNYSNYTNLKFTMFQLKHILIYQTSELLYAKY